MDIIKWLIYNMISTDPGFAQSEEAEIGQALLQAYEEGDQELLEQTVRRQHISFLDNEVAKLSRTLTVPGEMLSSGMGAPPSVASSTSASYASRPPPSSRPPRPSPAAAAASAGAPTSDIHAMSPAQVRAELYSTPASKKVPQQPTTTHPPPPQPAPTVEYHQPTPQDLDEEFARLNMDKPINEKKPSPAPVVDDDDDFDDLR